MSQSLTPMSGQVPAHIAKLFGKASPNAALAAGVAPSYPIISYKGKSWHIVEGGERILITQGGAGPHANDPAASLQAVIISANPNLNKVYYPDGYEEGSTERPLCHSDDAITPSPDAQEKQSETCGGCPHNAWGSKISETGSRGKAFADSRRMAIASPDDIENPMLLRCPAASLKTLLAYSQQLDKRGWPFQGLVTKIGFDASMAYPSLTFAPERWLTDDEGALVAKMMDDDLVQQITALKPQRMADAPTSTAPPTEDAFARMERTAPGAASAPETPAAPAARPRGRKPKAGAATAAEVQAAVGAEPAAQAPAAPPEAPAQPTRRGFGRGAAQPVEPAAAAGANGHDALGDEALAELEDVLSGFDDEEADEGDEE